MPAQSLPPFLLITAGVAGMGALQMGVHWMFKTDLPHDGPVQFKNYHGMDTWDYNMSNRDARLIQHAGLAPKHAGWWDFREPKPTPASSS